MFSLSSDLSPLASSSEYFLAWVYKGSKANFGGVPAYNSELKDGPYSNEIANGDKKDDL
jgi:hypothetical protein